MKRFISFSILITVFAFYSCGPAAESREQMHARAKTISDSMANLIRTAMAEAEMPAAPVVVQQPQPTNTAAAQGTVAPPNK